MRTLNAGYIVTVAILWSARYLFSTIFNGLQGISFFCLSVHDAMPIIITIITIVYNHLELSTIDLEIIYNNLRWGKYVPFPPFVVPLSAINWRSYNIQAALRWVHPLSPDNNIELQTNNNSHQIETNKGIRDAGSTADIRMLWPWSALVCLGLL